MIKIIVLTAPIRSTRAQLHIDAGTVCVYDAHKRAVYTGVKVGKSDYWARISESMWVEVGWATVKEEGR